ncbi:Gfo/Idh/MocA family oxidoreductase [Pantoea vagans]|uniref:Gfo/Idh/MocA family protein n=1 Tax=Pantoea vagans TaxID=470934 RepID=UPI00301A829C
MKTRVGIVGCGNICDRYFAGAARSELVEIVACSDIIFSVAQAKAELHSVKALTFEQMLESNEIDIILNLTIPAVHVEIGLAALAAGKHVYSEKPLGTSLDEARYLLEAAEKANLRIGCAPDSFFGASHQAARFALDRGVVGKILSGAICIATRGMEQWHHSPDFFYKKGGGPLLDMGPYYLAQLINILGPVKSLISYPCTGFPTRTIETGPRAGEKISVDIATTINGVMTFHSGAVVSVTASWDVWKHERNHIELYGELGTFINPNPVFYNGVPRFSRGNQAWEALSIDAFPFGIPTRESLYDGMVADYRMVGLVDMALAIKEGRPHRASGEIALHIFEILDGLEKSSGQEIILETTCERPEPIMHGAGEETLSKSCDFNSQ